MTWRRGDQVPALSTDHVLAGMLTERAAARRRNADHVTDTLRDRELTRAAALDLAASILLEDAVTSLGPQT